jgi:hypothetical protein
MTAIVIRSMAQNETASRRSVRPHETIPANQAARVLPRRELNERQVKMPGLQTSLEMIVLCHGQLEATRPKGWEGLYGILNAVVADGSVVGALYPARQPTPRLGTFFRYGGLVAAGYLLAAAHPTRLPWLRPCWAWARRLFW